MQPELMYDAFFNKYYILKTHSLKTRWLWSSKKAVDHEALYNYTVYYDKFK